MLSDLKVFSSYAQGTRTEMLSQQVELFNGATRGGLVLAAGRNDGDYNDETFWAKVSGIVRRRNAYGSGAVTAKNLSQLTETTVKVAAGTPPINIDPGMFKWIMKNPAEAGVVIGKQVAEETMADYLNTGVAAYLAALGQIAALIHDGTASTATLLALSKGASKFGDRSQAILCWMMHSKVAFDIYGEALTNAAKLFVFGNVRVIEDGFGRPLVLTDSASLIEEDGVSEGVDKYSTLGLSAGAITVEDNDEWTAAEETKTGDENIQRVYQAEWTFQLGIKGFSWDKTNGGHSPTTAALATATNWDRNATADKDLAGVIVETR